MANLEEQTIYDVGVYQIETDDVVIGGPAGVSNKPAKSLGNRTAWIKKQIDNTIQAANMTVDDTKLTSLAEAIANIAVENSAPSAISSALDSNSEVVGATSNAVKLVNDALNLLSQAVDNKASTDHSHQLPAASTSQSGITQLDSSLTSESEVTAATSKAIKAVNDDLSILGQAVDNKAPTNHSHPIPAASTSQSGISQLDSSLTSESEVTAATSKAIKAVNDALQSVIQDVVGLNTMLVGAPIPWPSTVIPAGCLEYRGQAFNPATYPILANIHPSHFLTDLRGEFIRGLDNGRGVDSGRGLLSYQGQSIQSHRHTVYSGAASTQNGGISSIRTGSTTGSNTSYYGGSETRPRNIAFIYITRAA